MDLDSVADERYGLDPGVFTAARDRRAREARAADRTLAEQIAKLRRPSLSAFAVNTFARQRRQDLDQLLALGEQLRAAQAALAGDELRALMAQRRDIVAAVRREIRRLANEHGHALSDRAGAEVTQTLDAALADPDLAGEVARGRDAAAEQRAARVVEAEKGLREDEAERARREAQRALEAAERRESDAAHRLRRATDAVSQARTP